MYIHPTHVLPNGAIVPRFALQVGWLLTPDRSTSDNVLQLIRRKSYAIDAAELYRIDPAILAGDKTVFIWDYAASSAAIACHGNAQGDMIRLYGTCDLPSSNREVTITYQGDCFHVHTDTTGNVASTDITAPVPASSSSTWEGGAGLPGWSIRWCMTSYCGMC